MIHPLASPAVGLVAALPPHEAIGRYAKAGAANHALVLIDMHCHRAALLQLRRPEICSV